ncbi:MAG TPA: anti-sigma factor [Burkholderiales bacterium]|nr:anti-sigma factor [Burkholderiales bacterium]
MNYTNPELREKLAAEYALGTLRGAARARFTRLMKYDPALRRTVVEWENRIYPILEAAPEIAPPARVWNAIKARIAGNAGAPVNLGFWRTLGLFSSGLAAVLLIYLSIASRPETPPAYMALLNDQKTQQPVLLVSTRRNSPELTVKALITQPIAADKTLELWALPAEQGTAPKSLGLVAASGVTRLKLQQPADQQLGNVPALAISLEPKGGSPTGLPTGPVLYVGKWLRL